MYSHIKIINLIPYVHIDIRDLLEGKSLILNKKYNIDNNFCQFKQGITLRTPIPNLAYDYSILLLLFFS